MNNHEENDNYIDLDFDDPHTEKKNGEHSQNDKIKSG
jgi:hypothetical protein